MNAENRNLTAVLRESSWLRLHAQAGSDLAMSESLAQFAAVRWPEQPSAWHTLGLIQTTLGKHADALASRQRAVGLLEMLADQGALAPERRLEVQHIVRGLAHSLLIHGRWKEAWPFWEMSRIGYSWRPWFDLQVWQGEKDGGLLVVPEGGFGDVFMFSRFLVGIVHSGPIGLVVPKGLRDFRDWLFADAVYEPEDMIPSGIYTYSTSLMSLPGLLGFGAADSVPLDRLDISAPRRHGIGFAWRAKEAGVEPGCRKIRSLDDASAQVIADGLPGPVYSLIPGAELGGVALLPERIATWSETAKFVAGLQFVITVDTAVAHIAGLVGTPTLLLLPLDSEWRYGLESTTTPWYASFRLYRNRDPLTWNISAILEAVEIQRAELKGHDQGSDHSTVQTTL